MATTDDPYRASNAHFPTLRSAEDALHFALKREQRVWGSGGDHEKARAEVERLEKVVEDMRKHDEAVAAYVSRRTQTR